MKVKNYNSSLLNIIQNKGNSGNLVPDEWLYKNYHILQFFIAQNTVTAQTQAGLGCRSFCPTTCLSQTFPETR